MFRKQKAENSIGMGLMLAVGLSLVLLAFSCEPAHAQTTGAVQIDAKAAAVMEKTIKSQRVYELRRTYSRPEKGAPHRETITIYQSSELKKFPQLKIDRETGEIKKLDKVKKANVTEIISRIWRAISTYGMAFGDEEGDTAYENIVSQDDYEIIWTYYTLDGVAGYQHYKDIQSATLFDGVQDCRVRMTKTYIGQAGQGFSDSVAYKTLI